MKWFLQLYGIDTDKNVIPRWVNEYANAEVILSDGKKLLIDDFVRVSVSGYREKMWTLLYHADTFWLSCNVFIHIFTA